MTIVTFLFHIGLVFTPIFLLSHNILWRESWGITWWSLPEDIADIMTLVVIFSCIFFFLRRIFTPGGQICNISLRLPNPCHFFFTFFYWFSGISPVGSSAQGHGESPYPFRGNYVDSNSLHQIRPYVLFLFNKVMDGFSILCPLAYKRLVKVF